MAEVIIDFPLDEVMKRFGKEIDDQTRIAAVSVVGNEEILAEIAPGLTSLIKRRRRGWINCRSVPFSTKTAVAILK